jgi:hypothetical protein
MWSPGIRVAEFGPNEKSIFDSAEKVLAKEDREC